ncbi:uncharacterized protein LOC135963002 [Calliphora vicina]|uniref:uncharacterized protein LOC135963002 n=1 Tax=Calliphora vicina TaxID=7373 RepID=UPI00325BE645
MALNVNKQQDIPTNPAPTVPFNDAQSRGPELLFSPMTQANSLPPGTRSLVAPVCAQVTYPGGREVTSVTYTQPQPAVNQAPWSNQPPPLLPAPSFTQMNSSEGFIQVPEPQINQQQQGYNNQQQQQSYSNQQQQSYNNQLQQGYNNNQQQQDYHQQQQQGYNYQPQPHQNLIPTPNYAWPMSNGFGNHQHVNLSKWGIKFDGTNKSLNAQEFIFRVNELRRDYNCSDTDILRHFHHLLEGPALDWYWNQRKLTQINSWQELENAILSQYQRFENEFQVQMQILNRRQLPHESFEDFYNAIIKLRHQQKMT